MGEEGKTSFQAGVFPLFIFWGVTHGIIYLVRDGLSPWTAIGEADYATLNSTGRFFCPWWVLASPPAPRPWEQLRQNTWANETWAKICSLHAIFNHLHRCKEEEPRKIVGMPGELGLFFFLRLQKPVFSPVNRGWTRGTLLFLMASKMLTLGRDKSYLSSKAIIRK